MSKPPINPCTLPAFMGYTLAGGEARWRVCAWCESKSAVDAEAKRLCIRVTHSICQKHATALTARIVGDRTDQPFYEQHTQRPTQLASA